ncbi:MAG TPA: hypothetical protein VLH86_00610 [Patescibacteria group bacterium]|nr:hypothetical protein [Patescibacteria group bacterium]
MSEVNVGQIKNALLSQITVLTEAAQTEAAVKDELEQHAARVVALRQKIGEAATELAALQGDVAKTGSAHEGAAKVVGEAGTAIAALGSEDSPLLEQSAGQLAAAKSGMDTQGAAMQGLETAFTEEAEALAGLGTNLEQQAGVLGGLSTSVEQSGAMVIGGIASAREWIAVAASK